MTIHRFIESVRQKKIVPFQDNFEISQPIDLAFDQSGEAQPLTFSTTYHQETITRDLPPSGAKRFRAPEQPGFFKIEQGGDDALLLRGATHFADTREADLQQAAFRNDLDQSDTALIDQHTEQDARWQLWILILCLSLLVSWHFVTRPATATT